MPTYGLETARLDGSIKFNGLSKGAVLVEVLSMAQGASGSKVYPRTVAGSVFYATLKAGGHRIVIDADPTTGAGRVNWTATDIYTDSKIYVFASKVITSDTYGIICPGVNGETLADRGYPVPQFVATVALNVTASRAYNTPGEPYNVRIHRTATFDLRGGSDKIVVMAMPDSGTKDTWYCLRTECIPAGAGSVYVEVAVYSTTLSYDLPTIHVFSINNPVPSSGLTGLQINDLSAQLTFDSGAEIMAIKDVVKIAFPGIGSTNTYTLGYSSGLPGLSLPFYFRDVVSGGFGSQYYGVAKRVGNQLTTKLILDSFPPDGNSSYELGSQINRYCPVVDVSYLNGAVNPGDPGNTPTLPTFSTHPSSANVTPGTTVTFTVSAQGNPAPSLQWYRNGQPLNGFTSTSYSLITSESDDGSTYYCRATNTAGAVNSNTAYLSVKSNNTPPPIVPVSFTQDPSSTTVVAGNVASFSVAVSGTSPVSLQWYRGSSPISGATGNTYSLTTSASDNGATFKCVATNGNGAYTATSGTATLTVTQVQQGANIYQQPQSLTVNQGDSAAMTCLATNANTYNWYRDGVYKGVGSTFSLDTSTSGTFSYQCRVYGLDGTWVDSSVATLTVNSTGDTPYTSYRNLSASMTLADDQVGNIDVYRDGSTYVDGAYIGSWVASGSGTGTMYTASGSGPGVSLEPGSDSFGVGYHYSDVSSVSFAITGGQHDGTFKRYTVTVSIRLNSTGSVVATVTVSITIDSQFG